MAVRVRKIVCLVLLCAMFAGTIAGCGQNLMVSPESTAAAYTAPPSYMVPLSLTAPPSTAPEPSQAPAEPEEPEPLPSGTGYTLQEPTAQKPLKPYIAVSNLSAKNYFIYDTRIGEFLYISSAANKALYPASTTKLFTSYVALQYLAPEDIVTVGKELSYVAYDASVAGFQKGDRVSVEALVYSALLPSGCDASYILAAAAGRVILGDKSATAKNAVRAFMDECNRLAKKLGMENTNLVTPDGYHNDDHKISMQAFAIIGKCCLENKLIARATASMEATVSYTSSSGKRCSLTLRNTNQIIQTGSKYYSTHAVGLKTGFTDDAGYCLLTAYQVDGRYILVGIFGCSQPTDRFQDANKLFNAYLPYL